MSLKWRPPLLTHWLSRSRQLSITLRVMSGVIAATSWIIISFMASKLWGRCWSAAISFTQFLNEHNLVRMHFQISMQDSSNTSIRYSWGCCMLSCGTSRWLLNWAPYCSSSFWACYSPWSTWRFTFQCRTCLSTIRNPGINGFLIGNRVLLTERKANAEGTLSVYWRSPIFNELLYDESAMFAWPSHSVHWKRHVCSHSRAHPQPLYSVAARCQLTLKLWSSFCRTLYFRKITLSCYFSIVLL